MRISKLISDRRSPRAFSKKEVSDQDMKTLFEAARWAPSSMNEQPWIYYYALKKDTESFNGFLGCLVPGNQSWAKNARAIILSVAKKHFDYRDRPNRHAIHDLGAANVLLALQASDIGMQAHQMGGFNMEITLDYFGLELTKYEPISFIAIGYPGDPETLPPDLRERELLPRTRKELSSFISKGRKDRIDQKDQ